MMKKVVIVLSVLFMAGRSWGDPGPTHGEFWFSNPAQNPIIMTDSVRGLTGNIMALIPAGREPETGAELNVIQETVGALEDGDESYRVDEGTGSGEGASDLAISAYDYMKDNVFSGAKQTPYGPLNQKLSGGNMEQVVKDMFFIQESSDNTEDKQKEIMAQRTDYLTTVGKEYTKLAYEMQKKIADDMSAVSADINGNGSIGAVAGMDQTWKAVNKALIADIGMQIQLMELDAAKFLSVQPLMLMSEKRPETSKPTDSKDDEEDDKE